MDPQDWPKSVQSLVDQGRMTPDAILHTLTKRIQNFGTLGTNGELSQLHNTFNSLSTDDGNGTKHITEPALTSYLQSTGTLPSSMPQAGTLIYRSLLYLSQAPLYKPVSTTESLTFDALLRALVWSDFDKSSPVYDESARTRTRSPADTRRLIFQSFASSRDGRYLPFDAEDARKQAERRAFDFSTTLNEDNRREFAKTNFDEDGDEMYHDLLDALYIVGQPEEIWLGGPPRDAFRPLAKEMRGREDGVVEDEPLHHLSIPRGEFRELVKVFVLAQFARSGNVQVDKVGELDRVLDCISRGFAQVPDLGITWEMFDPGVCKMPGLLASLRRILSILYKVPSTNNDNDIINNLPKSGHIATQPVLFQLATVLSDIVSFENLQLQAYYNTTDPTAAQSPNPTSNSITTLINQINTTTQEPVIILLLSGKITQTGESAVFGYHLPYTDEEPCLLLQLSPVHDVFRGENASRPGCKLDEKNGDLVFGSVGNGVALVLGKDLTKVTVSHSQTGGGGGGAPVYEASAWRGNWRADVVVEEIEVWVES